MALFDEEFYELLGESNDLYDNIFEVRVGDLLIYNLIKQKFDILTLLRCGKESDISTIGLILRLNNDDSYDIILKNYLTSLPERLPLLYINKLKSAGFYLKNLFDRYSTKYIRISNIDISNIKFKVPDIELLDIMNNNINLIKDVLYKIWSEDRYNNFFERYYTNGLLSTYKGKYYHYLPVIGNKREINNFDIGKLYEFLPMFNIKL